MRTLFFILIVTFAVRSQCAPLDQWHWRNPLPQGNQLFNLVSANGRFIAVGELGTILASTDGTNWTRCDSGTPLDLHDCAYGAGEYIAVGEFGTVLTSTNLVSWNPQYAGTFNNLNSIIYINSQFVAVGDEGTILTSPDGMVWTTRASGDWRLFGITYSGGAYVAVGGNPATGSSVGIGVILTSPDASVWSLAELAPSPFFSVTYGQGMFAVVGGADNTYGVTPSILTSTDGTTWSPVSNLPASAYSLTTIAYVQGKWLAGQGNILGTGPYYLSYGAIYSSPDNLENLSLVVSNGPPIEGLASANGQFVAAREDGTFLTSSDGLMWTNPEPESPPLFFQDLKYLNGSFVGVGNNTISFSPDGITWTNSVTETNGLLSITYGKGRYVAGSNYRTVWTSTDGINWSNPAPDIGIFPYSAETHVAFGNGMFVGAAGYYGDLLASPDGLSWTVQQLTNGYSYTYFNDVAFDGRRFVAVSAPLIASSADGTNWSVTGTSHPLSSVAGGNGISVAVGPNVVMTSSDGTNWTTQASSQFGSLSKVAFGGGYFVAVATQPSGPVYSESGIWISRDGLHWSKRDPNTKRGLSTVAYGNGTFVIGGDNSLILQSDPFVNLSMALTGAPQLSIDGPANRSYRIEYSDSLAAQTPWTLLTNITLPATPASLTDTTWTNSTARFYRAVLLP